MCKQRPLSQLIFILDNALFVTKHTCDILFVYVAIQLINLFSHDELNITSSRSKSSDLFELTIWHWDGMHAMAQEWCKWQLEQC